MKIKKLLSLLICLVIVLSVSLTATADGSGTISFDAIINGYYYMYEQTSLKIGEAFTISIVDVQLNGEAVNESEISYEWSRLNDETERFETIVGANESSFSENYSGCSLYSCTVTVDGNSTIREFAFKPDTLTVSATSDKPITADNDSGNYIVSPGLVNSTGSITVVAESSIPNATITYEWVKMPYYTYSDSTEMPEVLENETNTVNFSLPLGGESYCCTVDDGSTQKNLWFEIVPDSTITMTNTVNGKVPITYAGTYIYVVKPNEKVTVDITSTSTYGDVTYIWYNQNEDYSFTRMDTTDSIIELTKTAPTEQDPYAAQPFACYIEDGNQRIRYWIMLFCLDPEKSLSEVNKVSEETPDVKFATDNEGLANAVLTGEELQNLSAGMSASIGLSAELKNTVDNSDQTAINAKLQENEKIGMHLEMNLHKNIDGQAIPVTELDSKINLSVDVSENLVNKDSAVKREYQVIRMHDGVAEVLNCQFDEETNTLSFETDRFSLYTVTYKDVEVNTSGSIQPTEKQEDTKTQEAAKPQEESKTQETAKISETPKSPKTNGVFNYQLWVSVLSISIVGALWINRKNKNFN